MIFRADNFWKSKLMRKMRIVLLLIFTGVAQSFALVSYAQTTRLSINLKNETINHILEEIEGQSEFYFMFDATVIDVNQRKSIDCKRQSVTEILDELFKDTGISYKVSDRQIVLTSAEKLEVKQQKQVSGRVTDARNQPLPGVTVLVKGTTQGTVTNAEGNYTIANIPENAVLVFSFVGMRTQEVVVTGKAAIHVSLQEETIGIEEIVAIGYGTVKKKDLTGAVGSIKATTKENENPQSLQDILRGNIAGLEIGFSTSAKGQDASLEIRGKNSLKTSTVPLIVLDGVIYQGTIGDINPNDIESVDVLKDASSSAVFGARAANGVILITTKKGESAKPVINFDSNIGLATMGTKTEVYDAYDFITWRQDVLRSMNRYSATLGKKLYIFDDPNNLSEGVSMDMWRDGKTGDVVDIWLSRLNFAPLEITNYKAGKSVDWEDMVYQNGLRQDHNLSISGKKNDITYYWSLGYNNNNGIIVGDQFKTLRSRLNLDFKITGWLSVGLNTQFSNRDENNINASWGSVENNSPWGSINKDDGVTLRYSPIDDPGGGSRHPFYDRTFQTRLKTYNTLNNNIYGILKLPFGISYQINFTPNFEWYNYMNHQSALHETWALFGGQVTRSQQNNYYWQVDNLIKWNKIINEIHRFDVTLLANAEKRQMWSNSMSIQGFSPTDALGFHNVSAGTSSTIVISSNDTYATGDALMARMMYSLKDRYLATLSLRRDGYSAFGIRNPRGTFPAAALGWVFTEEAFFKNKFLSYGKLRLSWGENGNREIGIYDALSNMSISKYAYKKSDGTTSEYNILAVSRMANADLKWEKTRSLNLGLDFGLLKGVFNGSLELYRTNTLNLLVDRVLPNIIGFASVVTNLGEVQNKGVELTLNSSLMKRENFNWNLSFNATANYNEIVHLYGDMVDIKDESGNIIGQREADDRTNNWFIGHSIGEIWEPRILGVWQTGEESEASRYGQYPGDFKLKDVDNNGIINDLDNEFQGQTVPRFRLNLRQDFNICKNLEISFLIYSYLGYKGSYNVAKNRDGFPNRNNGYIFPYWTPENPLNDYARIYSAEGGASFNVWRDKSFVRLSNLSLACYLPDGWINKIGVSKLKFYGSINNVGYWAAKWDYWDPEYSGPNPRYFTLGINFTL